MQTTFRSAADQGFAQLSHLYATTDFESSKWGGRFWFAGNCLQTCLGYLLISGQPDQPGKGLVSRGYDLFKNMGLDQNGGPVASWWVDDYGWWGIALQIALKNRAPLGYSDAKWDSLFNSIKAGITICWDRMYTNWDPSPYSQDVQITGGVWNTKDTSQPLAGRNSVTNELFWILSHFLDPSSDRFKEINLWFQQWLALPKNQLGILNALGLVLERPEGLVDKNWIWTGDQGLFLSGLQNSGFSNKPDVAKAVLGNPPASHGLLDSDGVVHETGLGRSGGQFDLDYATGKGVLLRYLGSANQPFGQYSDFIKTNARAVSCNQFGLNWNPKWVPPQGWTGVRPETADMTDPDLRDMWAIVLQTAGQDALNAAMNAAGQESFAC